MRKAAFLLLLTLLLLSACDGGAPDAQTPAPGDTPEPSPTAEPVGYVQRAHPRMYLSAVYERSLGFIVTDGGELYMRGSNLGWQIVEGTQYIYDWTYVLSGVKAFYHSGDSGAHFALLETGELVGWGRRDSGGLLLRPEGDGSYRRVVMEDVADFAFNGANCFAVKSDGSLWAWGGDYGDPVKLMDGAAAVYACHVNCVVIDIFGSAYAVGSFYGGGKYHFISEPRLMASGIASAALITNTRESAIQLLTAQGDVLLFDPDRHMDGAGKIPAGELPVIARGVSSLCDTGFISSGSFWRWEYTDEGEAEAVHVADGAARAHSGYATAVLTEHGELTVSTTWPESTLAGEPQHWTAADIRDIGPIDLYKPHIRTHSDPEEFLSMTGICERFGITERQRKNASVFVISSAQRMEDLRYYVIEYDSAGDNGAVYRLVSEIYRRGTVQAGSEFTFAKVFTGELASRGISFVDESGVTRYFYVSRSYIDGSPLLVEFEAVNVMLPEEPSPFLSFPANEYTRRELLLGERLSYSLSHYDFARLLHMMAPAETFEAAGEHLAQAAGGDTYTLRAGRFDQEALEYVYEYIYFTPEGFFGRGLGANSGAPCAFLAGLDEYASLPSSAILTGAADDIVSAELIVKDPALPDENGTSLSLGRQAVAAAAQCLLGARAEFVPQPDHHQAMTGHPVYTITFTYADGSTDTVWSTMTGTVFYRYTGTAGPDGDPGYISVISAELADGLAALGAGGAWPEPVDYVQPNFPRVWGGADDEYTLAYVVNDDGDLYGRGTNQFMAISNSGYMDATYDWTELLTGVKGVYTGGCANFALCEKGALYGWGADPDHRDVFLQSGRGFDGTFYDLVMEDVAAFSTYLYDCFAVKTDGSLWAWGKSYGECVKLMDNIAAVSAGAMNFAIDLWGNAWVWGVNKTDDATRYICVYEPVFLASGIAAAEELQRFSPYHQLLTADGEILLFDTLTQIGSDGTLLSADMPVIAEDVKSLCHGGFIKNDGSLWRWVVTDDGPAAERVADGVKAASIHRNGMAILLTEWDELRAFDYLGNPTLSMSLAAIKDIGMINNSLDPDEFAIYEHYLPDGELRDAWELFAIDEYMRDTAQGFSFQAGQNLTDVRLIGIEPQETPEGDVLFRETSEIYYHGDLRAGDRFVFVKSYIGLLPTRAVACVDESGRQRYFTVSASGYDGSEITTEVFLAPHAGYVRANYPRVWGNAVTPDENAYVINGRGELYGRGNNQYHAIQPPREEHGSDHTYDWVKIMDGVKGFYRSGTAACFALCENGGLYGWGMELGIGTAGTYDLFLDGREPDLDAPHFRLVMEDVRAFSTWGNICCAVTSDNTLLVWGEGYGKVGSTAALMENIAAVSSGCMNIAIDLWGNAWAFGSYVRNGQRWYIKDPTLIASGIASAEAVDGSRMQLLTAEGELLLFDVYEQADDSGVALHAPMPVIAEDVRSVCRGGYIKNDGGLWRWDESADEAMLICGGAREGFCYTGWGSIALTEAGEVICFDENGGETLRCWLEGIFDTEPE